MSRREPVLYGLLARRREAVLEVLARHGVHLDPGTVVTLSSPLDKAAAYHAVPDRKAFRREVLAAARPLTRRRRKAKL